MVKKTSSPSAFSRMLTSDCLKIILEKGEILLLSGCRCLLSIFRNVSDVYVLNLKALKLLLD